MKVATLALAAFAMILAGIPCVSARAQQDAVEPKDEGYLYYESAKRKILRSAGKKVWDAAEQAKRRGFYQFAYEQAKRAIGFDPNHSDARDYLGYVKRRKEWVLDAEEDAKLKKVNQKSSGGGSVESQESFDKRVEDWEEKHLAKANQFVAAKYAVLGADCAKKGLPLQAIKGYEAALRLDPENSKARKGLGFKKMGKVWLTKKQDDARAAAAKATVVKGESPADQLLGQTLNKAESKHFRLEGSIETGELMEICTTLETLYAYYLSDLGEDPTMDVIGRDFTGGRATFVFVDNDKWDTWCDTYGNSELTRKLSGTSNHDAAHFGIRMKEQSNPVSRKDMSVHVAVHLLNYKVFRMRGGAWINEGLSYFYTVKLQETCLTHCVAIKKGNYANPGDEGGIKDWSDTSNWKPNVKEMVRKKSDVELRALVIKPITQLEFDATIKAWSVITWLMDTERDKFIELMDDLGGRSNHVNVLESAFEISLEELDQKWRKYVLRNY